MNEHVGATAFLLDEAKGPCELNHFTLPVGMHALLCEFDPAPIQGVGRFFAFALTAFARALPGACASRSACSFASRAALSRPVFESCVALSASIMDQARVVIESALAILLVLEV